MASMQDIQQCVNEAKRKIQEHVDVDRIKRAVSQFAQQHPVLTLYMAVATILFSIPILTFMCFIIATAASGCMAFIMIEGKY